MTGQTVDARKPLTASARTDTNRPASIELNEIFDINPTDACYKNDCRNIDGLLPIAISDHDPIPQAFSENDDVINSNEDEFLNSDNGVEEIEMFRVSQLDMVDNIGEYCERRQDLLEEPVGKQAVDLDQNCFPEYVFDDDFLLDNELCKLEY